MVPHREILSGTIGMPVNPGGQPESPGEARESMRPAKGSGWGAGQLFQPESIGGQPESLGSRVEGLETSQGIWGTNKVLRGQLELLGS